jgi:hypothetical protein
MIRRLVLTLAAGMLLLAGCGGSGTVADPAAGGGPAGQEPTSPEPSEPEPTMIGVHPAYPHADYTYDLQAQCFCGYGGQPVTVTVRDGEVESAVWSTKVRGHAAAGDDVTVEWLRLSINDVLEEAANPRWDEVEVDWPAGQEYPDRVAIDRMEKAIDDEITYVITNVEPQA